MRVFGESVVLPVDPSRAFAVIGNPANGPRIDPMIERYEPEGGLMGIGVRNHIRTRVFGLPMRTVSVTREWNPPERMVLEQVEPGGPLKMTLTQTSAPDPGGTLLTYRAEITGPGPAAAIFRWLIARNFRRAIPRVLALIDELPSEE